MINLGRDSYSHFFIVLLFCLTPLSLLCCSGKDCPTCTFEVAETRKKGERGACIQRSCEDRDQSSQITGSLQLFLDKFFHFFYA